MVFILGCDVIFEREFIVIFIILVLVFDVVSMEVMFVLVVLWVCMWIGSLGNCVCRELINSEVLLGFKILVIFCGRKKNKDNIK